jgi:hypothetical protein
MARAGQRPFTNPESADLGSVVATRMLGFLRGIIVDIAFRNCFQIHILS